MFGPFDFPPEIFVLICNHLEQPDLKACSEVCKSWNNLTKPLLWRDLVESRPMLQNEEYLKPLIENGHRIRHLQYHGTKLAQVLARPEVNCTKLKSLFYTLPCSYSDSNFLKPEQEVDLDAFLVLLGRNPSIRYLKISLRNKNLTEAISIRLLIQLKRHSQLRYLSITGLCSLVGHFFYGALRLLPKALTELEIEAMSYYSSPNAAPGTADDTLLPKSFPNLYKVQLGGTFFSSRENLIFKLLKRCPNLQELSVPHIKLSAHGDLVDFLPVWHPKLKGLVINDHGAPSAIQALMKPGQLQLRKLHLQDPPESIQNMLSSWADTLQDLEFGASTCLSSQDIQSIIMTCASLRRLVFKTESTLYFRCPESGLFLSDMADMKWACESSLRELALTVIDDRTIKEPESQTPLLVWYQQLARLKNIRALHLGWVPRPAGRSKDYPVHPMRPYLTIESGLDLWKDLKDLQILNIRDIDKVLMGQAEMEWIVKHWPNLTALLGLGLYKYKNDAQLWGEDDPVWDKVFKRPYLDHNGFWNKKDDFSFITWMRTQKPRLVLD
ncbi:hypothetical protein BCR41DRAFT_421226 [Lobosporangium transversale]|uniref:F-box domain-containing protein n=1 Tax=Lobosporangium transversale TaxID=64571 RepID=A0A1Y2GRI8_9FUNG|nr:hypothetical protein BCR41DRAFT_421226 [Lobosporangium transversale]ORZ20133.1 hypothetical protein BCR41DRAFT_421226 [Lobosporangium transversale]|eukprot:XP_021882673.1 hypothetical protein BCR41DRAFT_421226 [Lobosporangium transversale]